MAIAFRAGATGPSTNSATTYTMNLPAGLVDGDVVLAISPHTNGTTPTVPAGWTAIGNGKSNIAAGYKVWHTGDATTIVMTDSTGTFWQGVCVAYSGCDASNPVDDVGVHVVRGDNIAMNLYRAPSLVPSYNNEMAVALYGRDNSSSGGSWTAPSGWTSRQTSTGGPGVGIFEKALTGGTETGNADIAHSSTLAAFEFGATVLLRPASATTAAHSPIISQGAVRVNDQNSTSFAPDLTTLGVQNGDMVLVAFANGTTISTTPTGYTLQAIDTGVALYTHPWATGDTTTPTWTFTSSAFRLYTVVLLRTKGGTAPVIFDVAGHSNGAGTVTTPSLTPAGSGEFLTCFFGDSNTSGGEAITSAPALDANDVLGTFGPEMVYGFKRGISSATGTFSATLATAHTLGAIAALFRLTPAAATALQLAVTIVS